MIGDGVLGSFDPSHQDDPDLPCRVWRAHSVVDVSPAYGLGAISTRMAVSDDCGKTFVDVGLVNPSEDLPNGFASNHEVPSLVYCPGDTAPWKLVTFHVFNSMEKPGDSLKRHDLSLAWIGLRSATSPLGPWGVEMKLMAGSLNNPSVGGPARFVSDALVVSEPALLACPGGFWMAYQANTGPNASDMQLRLCKITGSMTVKTESGAFFSAGDLFWLKVAYQRAYPALASAVAFTAPCLFEKGDSTWLIATPVDSAYRYLGLCVFRVASLDQARLEKTIFWPKLYNFIGTGEFCGAGAYSAHSTGSGVCLSNLSLAQSPMFQIVNTGVQIG